MKPVSKPFYLLLVASVGIALCDSRAQEGTEETALASETTEDAETEPVVEDISESSSLSNKYQVIVDRNPFNLQPPAPPPPPKVEEEAPKESVSLKELNIVLAGVSAKNGEKRAWLSMTLPPSQPEQKPVERFFGFRENEQQHGLTVKTIKANGEVDIVYDGTPVLLTFETHGNKKKSTSKSKQQPKSNVRTARSSAGSSRSVTARTGTSRTSTGRTSSGRTTQANTGRSNSGRTIPVGRTSSATRSIPARPVRTQPQAQLSREEQITLLETQKALAEKEGLPFPPLPPLRR